MSEVDSEFRNSIFKSLSGDGDNGVAIALFPNDGSLPCPTTYSTLWQKVDVLIRLYRSNPDIKLSDFCRANNVSEAAFKTWLKKYGAEGLSGLYRSKKTPSLLPEGVDETEETLRRELIKTRIELERLKRLHPDPERRLGRRESSCLYPRRVRDHRGALAQGVPP